MAEIIIMPKLGFNMSVGKLVKWYKNEGDPVTKGEPVFAIETDKTSIDIEATQDGVFRKKFIEEGDSIEVTLPIAIIADAAENIDAVIQDVNRQLNRKDTAAVPETSAPASTAVSTSSAPSAVAANAGGRQKITPRARRVASEQGLCLEGLVITGTGYDGGICEKDILDYLSSNKVRVSPVARKMAEAQGIALEGVQGSGAHGKIMKRDIAASEKPMVKALDAEIKAVQAEAKFSADGKEIMEVIPYSGVRKIIGDRLAQSKFTAPHLYFTQKVNLDKLLELRKQINGAQEKKTSVTDYIARATIKCLQKYPDMNESLVGGQIEKYKSVNLGIAVAAPTGLIVPNIKNSNQKTVVEISKEASVLFDKARKGKLTPDEYTGGTFTISNLGMFGIENFTAIINPPEVGILAISATKDEPFVVQDANGNKSIEIKPMMNITLTVDHRVIDGLLAAQFVTEIKRMLENPIELLV
jgi:Pyruvate/2-oxoglutarate dehydrogenase complex, dihydrolipoamide acyltransferase (E2) component, and related enzymes